MLFLLAVRFSDHHFGALAFATIKADKMIGQSTGLILRSGVKVVSKRHFADFGKGKYLPTYSSRDDESGISYSTQPRPKPFSQSHSLTFKTALIDPCNGWSFNELWQPMKPVRTDTLPKVKDMSIDGLDFGTVADAIKNMASPAKGSDKVTLGRWAKKSGAQTDSHKYT